MEATKEAAATCERPTAWHRKDVLPMLFDFSTKLPLRFWSKVVADPSGCWLWRASTAGRYGCFWIGSQRIKAHRLVYQMLCGPIPAGLLVCHHCDIPICVRPDHLFVGTQSDNMLDAARKGRVTQLLYPKTHCRRGHPYDLINTHYSKKKRKRYCRACDVGRPRSGGAEHRAKLRAILGGSE